MNTALKVISHLQASVLIILRIMFYQADGWVKGLSRQWKNRIAGTPVNVWQNIYNNTHTGYSPVVYPEFKGYYGEVSWMELSTVEGKFYIASPDTGLFVRLFDFYALSDASQTASGNSCRKYFFSGLYSADWNQAGSRAYY